MRFKIVIRELDDITNDCYRIQDTRFQVRQREERFVLQNYCGLHRKLQSQYANISSTSLSNRRIECLKQRTAVPMTSNEIHCIETIQRIEANIILI
jgi:hypothetical protein